MLECARSNTNSQLVLTTLILTHQVGRSVSDIILYKYIQTTQASCKTKPSNHSSTHLDNKGSFFASSIISSH